MRAKGRQKDAALAELVQFTLVAVVLPGLAVAVSSLLLRALVDGWWGAAMFVAAILGAGYALMGLGGAAMSVVIAGVVHAATKDDERPVRAMGHVLIAVLFLSIPLSAVLLGYDRDQWIWGVSSTAAGLAIALYALVVVPSRGRSTERR